MLSYHFIYFLVSFVVVNYAFLRDLLAKAEAFEGAHAHTGMSVQDFACWVLLSGEDAPPADAHIGTMHMAAGVPTEKVETSIARMVIYMYRYAKTYTRKALEGSPLQTADEFGYLATLLSFDHLKKTELIALNIHEKPTGMDIIKRLLAAGLIDQVNDTADRRSKLLRINDAGRALLFRLFARMGKVSDLVGGELTDVEKRLLLHLLRKLDAYHHDIFLNRKEEVLASL